MSYIQAKSDYNYLRVKYGGHGPYDFCGQFCNTDLFESLLEEPTKKKAEEIFSKMIIYFFQVGAECEGQRNNLDLSDKKTKVIFDRYSGKT